MKQIINKLACALSLVACLSFSVSGHADSRVGFDFLKSTAELSSKLVVITSLLVVVGGVSAYSKRIVESADKEAAAELANLQWTKINTEVGEKAAVDLALFIENCPIFINPSEIGITADQPEALKVILEFNKNRNSYCKEQ